MRVLFLDVDGVLNSGRHFCHTGVPTGARGFASFFDREACHHLATVLSVTQAKIVISSSRRFHHTKEEFQDALAQRDVAGEVIDFTPIMYNPDDPNDKSLGDATCRGDEIAEWLIQRRLRGDDIESYAIIDDNDDMGSVQHRLVQTTWRDGMLNEHISPLIRMLMRPLKFKKDQWCHVLTSPTTFDLARVMSTDIRKINDQDHIRVRHLNGADHWTPTELITDVFPAYPAPSNGKRTRLMALCELCKGEGGVEDPDRIMAEIKCPRCLGQRMVPADRASYVTG